ncbi:MAG: hypothetical protein ACRC68_12950 [Clostridium sp.]
MELEKNDLVGFLENTMNKYKVPSKYLEIEITETAVLNNVEFVNERNILQSVICFYINNREVKKEIIIEKKI